MVLFILFFLLVPEEVNYSSSVPVFQVEEEPQEIPRVLVRSLSPEARSSYPWRGWKYCYSYMQAVKWRYEGEWGLQESE